ncbi:rhodanese-like domain-containing protein [Hymenobacter lutimineralis]|uniref:Rhodanese-like domain-containing protein n=1 Tax=Hymenobacter lutimineralis TaxID=2606448 RepID=A0A5D6UZL1_9BACT|nr:rhodanese-like domain-containing protein [Hymenobacter lutimineralis]TYZ08102.1 rhodanese-like domain-containing protein [Hymenobacter lutimineralis]
MKLLRAGLLWALVALLTGKVALAQAPTPPPPDVTPAKAAKLIRKRQVVVLDVRTPEEYAAGHLAGARNVNFKAADFAQQVAQLDTTQTYLLYCASGNRSSKAAALMRQQGVRKVVNAGALKDLQTTKPRIRAD